MQCGRPFRPGGAVVNSLRGTIHAYLPGKDEGAADWRGVVARAAEAMRAAREKMRRRP